MILRVILAALALLSLALLFWQWLAARRFPLHQRAADRSFAPGVTLLKPLKGCDATTADSLRSWFAQDYPGPIQMLFGVASADDPVCERVRRLIAEHPHRDAQLIVGASLAGPNAKVSLLAGMEALARHDVIVVSDADVRVPPDLLGNVALPFRDSGVGVVSCLYRLANPTTLAMQWEAVATNADFWSQVLQSRSVVPLDFALGAVMAIRRSCLEEIGGFKALADCLADDFQLGNRIARRGHRIALCPVVVECWDPPATWRAAWKHQLRWARTIRVCRPVPYFFSILSNATLWPLLWCIAALWAASTMTTVEGSDGGGVIVVAVIGLPWGVWAAAGCLVLRILAAFDLQRRLSRSTDHVPFFWMVPVKDLLQAAVWLGAFAGNRIEWRGQRFRLRPDGTLVADL